MAFKRTKYTSTKCISWHEKILQNVFIKWQESEVEETIEDGTEGLYIYIYICIYLFIMWIWNWNTITQCIIFIHLSDQIPVMTCFTVIYSQIEECYGEAEKEELQLFGL